MFFAIEATRAAEAVALSENDLAASALETAEKLREQFDAEAAMRREAEAANKEAREKTLEAERRLAEIRAGGGDAESVTKESGPPMSPPGPRRREASPASPASLGGADRWERKSPAPTPAATVLRGWNRTPEQPMPGAQPLPGLVDTTARKSAPTDDDSEDEGWGRG